jgi:DNA-binding beta-propeller fold protein YncE
MNADSCFISCRRSFAFIGGQSFLRNLPVGCGKTRKHRFLWSRLRIGTPGSQPLTEPRPKEAEQLVGFSRKLLVGMLLVVSAGGAPPEKSVATRVAAGDYPLNLLEIDGRFLISTNNGYGANYLQAYDESRAQVTGKLELPSLWFGLAYEPTAKLLLASDGKSGVQVVPFEGGVFGKPKSLEVRGCKLTAAVVFQDRQTAIVACNQNHEVVRFDIASGEVKARLRVGEFPFAIQTLPGSRVAVSNWGQSSITVIDLAGFEKLAEIKVGSHPNQMLVIPEANDLVVSSSDSDSVSLIDLATLREIRRIDLRPPGTSLSGVQPNALAYGNGRLFVALAGVNGVAVFRVTQEKDLEMTFEGVLPVGAFPTALVYSANVTTLFVANGRNLVTGPSAVAEPGTTTHSLENKPFRYVADILGGGIEALTGADFEKQRPRLRSLAEQIYGDRKVAPRTAERQPPIKYVFYVIKENRTYDQVLGDMPEGNGSRELAIFGEKVTPNHHALAREYVLFDNFYVNGDVSADGHFWSTAGTSTEYVSKMWPHAYSQRTPETLDAPYDGDADHDRPVAAPQSGFLWDRLLQAGISFRNYGEWYSHENDDPKKMHAYLAGLKNHSDMKYSDDIGDVTDQQRVDEWEREFTTFEKSGRLPRFSIIYLPSDHTVGTRPGSPTPTAMVADNDLALGRVVQRISKSRYWKESAIFVLEDDAQDGPDHVDAHRSPLLVISPYTRRHAVSSASYSTVSVVKTMGRLLGIGSLTYFDDRAPSLFAEFQAKPSAVPYLHRRPEVSLDQKNPKDAPGAKESSQWDFSGPDRAPWFELNRVIWQSVKGTASEPPPPVFRVASSGM